MVLKARKAIPKSNIDNLKKSLEREKWDGRATYKHFWELKLRALQGVKTPGSITVVNSKRTRLEEEEIQQKRRNKNVAEPQSNKKKKKKRKKKKVPTVVSQPISPSSPIISTPREEVAEEDPETPPERTHPNPPLLFSTSPPPPLAKEGWNSRIGYFMTLSDLRWYEIEPKIVEEPFVTIDFESEPDQYLSLTEGQSYLSDWYEQGVIRGLSVDVHGTHTLNYAMNGDFES